MRIEQIHLPTLSQWRTLNTCQRCTGSCEGAKTWTADCVRTGLTNTDLESQLSAECVSLSPLSSRPPNMAAPPQTGFCRNVTTSNICSNLWKIKLKMSQYGQHRVHFLLKPACLSVISIWTYRTAMLSRCCNTWVSRLWQEQNISTGTFMHGTAVILLHYGRACCLLTVNDARSAQDV